jgi:hypothetical protein
MEYINVLSEPNCQLRTLGITNGNISIQNTATAGRGAPLAEPKIGPFQVGATI